MGHFAIVASNSGLFPCQIECYFSIWWKSAMVWLTSKLMCKASVIWVMRVCVQLKAGWRLGHTASSPKGKWCFSHGLTFPGVAAGLPGGRSFTLDLFHIIVPTVMCSLCIPHFWHTCNVFHWCTYNWVPRGILSGWADWAHYSWLASRLRERQCQWKTAVEPWRWMEGGWIKDVK